MESQNKQWVCQTAVENHGQPVVGPEDLSSNSRARRVERTDATGNGGEIGSRNGPDEFFIQQVEDAICENSRQTIVQILDEVGRLTSTEKLLLYLKLPTDLNNVSDPLRQPLNPLGSRTEISQTIMWIRTHLEEDPELSLPKQEVYNEYTAHCLTNKMKPLSTADFGKVMKQVYPSVRPRRLGTRGNSRYCYAGLRKKFKLEVPQLPELGDKPCSTESPCTSAELTMAAWMIVREWAEGILGMQFQSMFTLAVHLVNNVSINNQSPAAILIKNTGAESKDLSSGWTNWKHKETQLQLQKKIQQRELVKEQKRKSQVSAGKGERTTIQKCKKSKWSISEAESESQSQEYQANPVCDNKALPDFSSFQVKKTETEDVYDINQVDEAEPEPNAAGKLPIPRLGRPLRKPPVLSQIQQQHKYKTIQPKPAPGEVAEGDGDIDIPDVDYLSRERLISVSNVDKDALDDYLHGGNNSQEQEEELLRYFKGTDMEQDEKNDKLSQLRLLLMENLQSGSNAVSYKIPQTRQTGRKAPPPTSARRRVSFETGEVPASPNTRRKNFSFTPISPGPPSPAKCCSSNASPFVSPRDTPVPRRRPTLRPLRPPPLEPELAMSAPPSPMPHKRPGNLLQKLLDSEAKVCYVPDYDKEPPLLTPEPGYRSQSAPVHQMYPFSFPSAAPTPAPTPTSAPAQGTEFDFDPDILGNGLNNDNLSQILNILDGTADSAPSEDPAPLFPLKPDAANNNMDAFLMNVDSLNPLLEQFSPAEDFGTA